MRQRSADFPIFCLLWGMDFARISYRHSLSKKCIILAILLFCVDFEVICLLIPMTYDFNYFFDKYITDKYTTQYHSPPQAPLGLRFCTRGLGGQSPPANFIHFSVDIPPLFFGKLINKGGISVVIWTDRIFFQKKHPKS